MANGDEACSLIVKADGLIELQCEGAKYQSTLLYDRHTKAVVERLDRLAKMHPGACEQADWKLLGDTLFNVLFGQKVKQVFEADNREVKEADLGGTLRDTFFRIVDSHKSKQRLRLRLVFQQGADNWANLPWEFLYASRADDTGFFVAGDKTTLSLTRIIEPPVQGKEPSNPPSMLLILAQPRELKFELLEGFDKLQNRLRNLLALQSDGLEPMNKPTWDALAKRLAGKDVAGKDAAVPDIIHFIGHGRFCNGQSQIALHRSKEDMDAERASNPQVDPLEADWRDVRDLSGQLVQRAPWLFFLQTCSSGRPDPSLGAFCGAAEEIAQADVPFVVAMQYDIEATDARKFADAFYGALGGGASVDEAVMQGREALGKLPPVYGHPRFATPVVYLRSERGFLPRPRTLGSTSRVDTAADLWPQHCPASCSPPQLLYDKRKWCRCDKKISLVYCTAGHVNVAGDRECGKHGCSNPLEEIVVGAGSAAPQQGG